MIKYLTWIDFLEFPQDVFRLFTNQEHRIFPQDACRFAILFVYIRQGHIRGIVLHKSHTWAAWHSDWEMEVEITLVAFLLPLQCSADEVMSHYLREH